MLLNFRLFFLCCHLAFDVRHPGLVAASRLGSWTVSFLPLLPFSFFLPFARRFSFFFLVHSYGDFFPVGFQRVLACERFTFKLYPSSSMPIALCNQKVAGY